MKVMIFVLSEDKHYLLIELPSGDKSFIKYNIIIEKILGKMKRFGAQPYLARPKKLWKRWSFFSKIYLFWRVLFLF